MSVHLYEFNHNRPRISFMTLVQNPVSSKGTQMYVINTISNLFLLQFQETYRNKQQNSLKKCFIMNAFGKKQMFCKQKKEGAGKEWFLKKAITIYKKATNVKHEAFVQIFGIFCVVSHSQN